MTFALFLWLAAAVLACVGFIHLLAWLGVRAACKGNPIYRVIPIGGTGRNTGNQMSLLYACLQWECNPSRQVTILYDAGLDEQTAHDCQILADAVGVQFIRSSAALLALVGDQCL